MMVVEQKMINEILLSIKLWRRMYRLGVPECLYWKQYFTITLKINLNDNKDQFLLKFNWKNGIACFFLM